MIEIEKRLLEGKKDIMYKEKVQHKEMNIREIWRDELSLTKKVESNYWLDMIHEMIHGIEAHRKK